MELIVIIAIISFIVKKLKLESTNSDKKRKNQIAKNKAKEKINKEIQNASILERAKENTAQNKEDITLHILEAEHNHSERVAPAEHNHAEDVLSDNLLGSVEELMVKGYDGNLCFERDFVGEALDMISRFTVPSEVPDFAKNQDDVA